MPRLMPPAATHCRGAAGFPRVERKKDSKMERGSVEKPRRQGISQEVGHIPLSTSTILESEIGCRLKAVASIGTRKIVTQLIVSTNHFSQT